MLKYTVKRLLQSLVTIFLIATAVFLMMRCLPTDYYFTEEQLMKFTDQQKTAALEAAGLTDPIPTQLIKFYNDLLHLDFGTSRRIQNGASVVKVIGKKFGVSMRLGLTASGISLVLGVLMGILQAAFKDKVFDWIGTAYTVFVNAVPSLVSYSLVLVFGSKYLGFPTLYSTRNVGPSSVLPIVMGIAIAICATGATFGVVMTIFSFCNTLAELPNTLSPMFAYKKYPKCCDNSSVHMNRKVAYVLSVLTFIVCAYLCVQMAATLSGGAVAGILAVFVVGYVYFFFRVKYLKGKGVDLIAEMKAPYQPWEDKEKSYN